jgi:uncharacterized RDD family membrane protein YckC
LRQVAFKNNEEPAVSTSSSNLELNFRPDGTLETIPRWKQELNERLAATRARHGRAVEEHATLPSLDGFSTKQESRASRLAAKVAERYANAPSYSEMLAAEARAAAIAAVAAVAAAEEARDRAQALLAGLETPAETLAATQSMRYSEAVLMAGNGGSGGGVAHESGCQEPLRTSEQGLAANRAGGWIADEFVVPAPEAGSMTASQPLPVNLIEFPRELVAPRRARPRLEEGPLRESLDDADGLPPLRIFEAEPRRIPESLAETANAASAVAEWSSIRLDANPVLSSEENRTPLDAPLQAASLEDRLMAAIFDAALVLMAFVLFLLVFAACTAHPPMGTPALAGAGLVLGGLFLLYQYLFFKFGEGTPGMRYAKIALCTFDDENPTRAAMRRRIGFLILSAAPLGLGLAWAWFDEDRLAWHDRLTRMYLRSYR